MQTMRMPLFCILCLTAVAAWSGTEIPARRPLSADDLERVQDVSDPQVAPDGTRIVVGFVRDLAGQMAGWLDRYLAP